MSQVVITLLYNKNRTSDLALPLNIPAQILAKAVAHAIGVETGQDQPLSLAIRYGKEIRNIAPEETLAHAGVMYGDYLIFSANLPSPSSPPQTKSCLQSEDGIVLSLNERITSIGRRTPVGMVDIDLTPLDPDKLVTRHHASIELDKNQYVLIDENSYNGTQVNGKTITAKKPYVLKNGDVIQLGGSRGVRLKFIADK